MSVKSVEKENKKKAKIMKKKIIKYVIIGLCILLVIWIVILNIESEKLNYSVRIENENTIYEIEQSKYIESEEQTDLVKIEVEDYGAIVAELYAEVAPITVENFKKLVSNKYYDGLIFHRVIDNFMIQTGDPTGTGSGGSEETIKGEFENNGVENPLSHTRGILSMARLGGNPDTEETMNSASSQFFIVQSDSTYLDGNYASFAEVVKGISVVDKIAKVSTDEYDKPLKDVVIKSIRFVSEEE